MSTALGNGGGRSLSRLLTVSVYGHGRRRRVLVPPDGASACPQGTGLGGGGRADQWWRGRDLWPGHPYPCKLLSCMHSRDIEGDLTGYFCSAGVSCAEQLGVRHVRYLALVRQRPGASGVLGLLLVLRCLLLFIVGFF